jgi:hypothetical protein
MDTNRPKGDEGGGGDAMTLPQSALDHQHVTAPVALSEHAPVERADSATAGLSGEGGKAAPSPDTVVAHATAPTAVSVHQWCHPATTAANVPDGAGPGGLYGADPEVTTGMTLAAPAEDSDM